MMTGGVEGDGRAAHDQGRDEYPHSLSSRPVCVVKLAPGTRCSLSGSSCFNVNFARLPGNDTRETLTAEQRSVGGHVGEAGALVGAVVVEGADDVRGLVQVHPDRREEDLLTRGGCVAGYNLKPSPGCRRGDADQRDDGQPRAVRLVLVAGERELVERGRGERGLLVNLNRFIRQDDAGWRVFNVLLSLQ